MSEQIKISEFDFIWLQNLMKFYHAPKLQNELERANVIKDILVTPDLVTIDSAVVYKLNDQIYQSSLVTSKVPEEQKECISVLDELGTALLGLSENQEIKWKHSTGEWDIRVLNVIYQPEAEGELHPLCFRN